MSVIGRFAPSPSGRMHLGNVFTALLAWLSVRAQGGELLLRLEDLDPARCRPEYARQIQEDLRWLGLTWDREQTPQRFRADAYGQCVTSLQAHGLVYPCYCSRADLHASSAPHGADGRLIYGGACRGLSPQQRLAQTKSPAWRLLVPDQTVGFVDGLQGPFAENLDRDCGDFIIRRADGVYAYQLAVVVDDLEGGVTQVVRGLDLLESTPRQLYLYHLLGGAPPQYYHTPLLLAPDGRRLSKRERDLDMGALRLRYSPEALIGYLAQLAGLWPSGAPCTAAELAQQFQWSQVRATPVVVNLPTESS